MSDEQELQRLKNQLEDAKEQWLLAIDHLCEPDTQDIYSRLVRKLENRIAELECRIHARRLSMSWNKTQSQTPNS